MLKPKSSSSNGYWKIKGRNDSNNTPLMVLLIIAGDLIA
jgi:hypothetical protein